LLHCLEFWLDAFGLCDTFSLCETSKTRKKDEKRTKKDPTRNHEKIKQKTTGTSTGLTQKKHPDLTSRGDKIYKNEKKCRKTLPTE